MRNKKRKPIFFIAILINCLSLSAQELNIYYNLHNDEISYKKEGKPVENPIIKRGDEVVLHLTEFNHFIYRAELEISQQEFIERSGVATDASLMSGLLPGMPTPGLLGMSGMAGFSDTSSYSPLGLFNIPLLKINDNPITLASLFGKSRGSEKVLEELASTTQEIELQLEELNALAEKLKKTRKTVATVQLAGEYVETIKTNNKLKPTFIKNMCEDYYEAIFEKKPANGIVLNDILALQDRAFDYAQLLNDFNAGQSNLTNKINQLNSLARQFKSYEIDDEAYYSYAKKLTNFLDKSKQLNGEWEKASLDRSAQLAYPTQRELTALQLQLAEVIQSDFTHHSRLQVTGDHLSILIKLVKKEDEGSVGEGQVVKSRLINYHVRGGLKITGSVGINFSQYLDPAQEYSVKDGLIVGEEAGAFTPVMSSFIHFYSYSGKRVSLGGSFGMGFPLSTEGGDQSIQFFVGPSLIFGNSQRMVMNFGLTGGRVTRLARGFQVGDEFDIFAGDIPTRNPYEIGLFVGASFNLGGG